MPSATGNNSEAPEMSEAHLLAPWYVTGKLDEAEIRELEELAKEEPEFALLLAEAKREAEADVFVNETLDSPPKAIWERLERSIELEKQTQRHARIKGFIEAARNSVTGFLAGLTKPQWQAVAAAAVAVCVLQAAAITYLAYSGRTDPKYVTASGPKDVSRAKPAAFIVSFSPNATIAEINSVLDGAEVNIVDGPNADMLYHLGIRNDNVTKDQVYQKMRSSAVVKLILPEK